jgi:hypothetical protein
MRPPFHFDKFVFLDSSSIAKLFQSYAELTPGSSVLLCSREIYPYHLHLDMMITLCNNLEISILFLNHIRILLQYQLVYRYQQ